MTARELLKFSVVLQSSLSSSDTQWNFHVPSIPHHARLNQAGLIKYVALCGSNVEQAIRLSLEPARSNRAISSIPLHRLLVISFANFRLFHQRKNASSDTHDCNGGDLERGTEKETKDYTFRLLSCGMTLNGTTYNFYGHSNSQLKSRTCFLYAGTKLEISKMIEGLGDFATLHPVAKKAKRIGLLFSAAKSACILPSERYEDIDDIERGGYTFTDGCGLISFQFAKQLVNSIGMTFRNRRYLPSVYQIRYRGYKGVVELDKRMKGKVYAKFRKSMRKFKGGHDLSFAVVEFSKPYAFGHLNDEIILLLHELGVEAKTLLSAQEAHLRLLSAASALDPQAVFRFLSYVDAQDLAERGLFEGPEAIAPQIRKLVAHEFDSLLNKHQEQRCRIFVLNSRLLFGVCDPIDCLRAGECFVRVTIEPDGQPRTLKNTQVLVTRNPCLHPGDLQKFSAVDRPELSHLVDCIVFSTRGPRPSADLMSGGDLDGDKFFVCWDKDLVPNSLAQAAEYPAPKQPPKLTGHINDEDRLKYFANALNSSLGKVKNLYLNWARLKGPLSSECQELNRLFSQCVDGNRIQVPGHLEDLPAGIGESSPRFILDVLHAASVETLRYQSIARSDLQYCSFDALSTILSDCRIASTEFELIQLTFRWCSTYRVPFAEFSHNFDFNLLTPDEKAWVATQLPEEELDVVHNSLNQSYLLHQEELAPFRLGDPRIHWKRVFDSTTDRLSTFFEINCRVCEQFERKLLVLRVDERLTIAIYIPAKSVKGQETLIDDKARLFSFPQPWEPESTFRRALKTKKDYRLYCDDGILQLYENRRANTWIFLKNSAFDDSAYRNVRNEGDRRRFKQATVDVGTNKELIASVDLARFSQTLRTQIGRVNRNGVIGAEIYVISNKDLSSFRTLDLWLDYVDTETIHPQFSREPQTYECFEPDDVDCSGLPASIAPMMVGNNFSTLRQASAADLDILIRLLVERGEKARLYKVCQHLLREKSAEQAHASEVEIFDIITQHLPSAPYLVLALDKAKIWNNLPLDLETKLSAVALQVLRAITLQINEIGFLVGPAFRAISSRWRFATMKEFGELIQLMSFTISDYDLAMDLLLTCLEPLSMKVLIARPTLTNRFVNSLIGLALNYIEDANAAESKGFPLLTLKKNGRAKDYYVCEARIRIDFPASASLLVGDHVRLTPASAPSNSPLLKLVSIDALVFSAERGHVVFNCFQQPPDFTDRCSWKVEHRGSSVTNTAMFDATVSLYLQETEDLRQLCGLLNATAKSGGLSTTSSAASMIINDSAYAGLNPSQRAAVRAGLCSPLTCLLGPPGTGKTHTVCTLLALMLERNAQSRILVTAPTNNAVDNMLRMFIKNHAQACEIAGALRISTDMHRVAPDLHAYAVDGILNDTDPSRFKALKFIKKRIANCRLIFTTCIGAGLGLLRQEPTGSFDTVLIDEASQVTEPQSYVPLVKGCGRAVLVGDHVQLRPVVNQRAATVGLDVSLFERLYTASTGVTSADESANSNGEAVREDISRVMLDTQYRMPTEICEFSSKTFYNGKLKTAATAAATTTAARLAESLFPWPKTERTTTAQGEDAGTGRTILPRAFVQCSVLEDIGSRSKCNPGQAQLAKKILELLLATPASKDSATPVQENGLAKKTVPQSIVFLTPYTRQRELLQTLLPSPSTGSGNMEVSSIDGYQGKEADIVVFVTVRCNLKGELGFLKDMRRLNVALTRAKKGLIVIGDRPTLVHRRSGGRGEEGEGEANKQAAQVWRRLLEWLPVVTLETKAVTQKSS